MKVFRLPLLSYLYPADNGRGISAHIHRPTSTEIKSQYSLCPAPTHNTVQSLHFVVVLIIIIRNRWTATYVNLRGENDLNRKRILFRRDNAAGHCWLLTT